MECLDRFLSEQNVGRFRKLLDASTDQNERAVILELLPEEMTKLKPSRPSTPNQSHAADAALPD